MPSLTQFFYFQSTVDHIWTFTSVILKFFRFYKLVYFEIFINNIFVYYLVYLSQNLDNILNASKSRVVKINVFVIMPLLTRVNCLIGLQPKKLNDA